MSRLEVLSCSMSPPTLGANTYRVRVRVIGEDATCAIDTQTCGGLWFQLGWGASKTYVLTRGEHELDVAYELYSSVGGEVRITIGERLDEGYRVLDPIVALQVKQSSLGEIRGRSGMGFRRHSTDMFDIYVGVDTAAERSIDEIAAERSQAVHEICSYLGVQPQDRITMVFYPDAETKYRDTGHTGHGWAFGTTLMEIRNDEVRVDPYHELTHILASQIGSPPALFNEGLATYLPELFCPTERTADERVRAMAADLWPLEELLAFSEIGSAESRPQVAYPQAASIVKFLINESGREKFLAAYRLMRSPTDAEMQTANLEIFRRVFGADFGDVERRWRLHVLG